MKRLMVTRWQLLLVACLVAVPLLLMSFGDLILTSYRLNREAEALQVELAQAQAEGQELEVEVEYRESKQGLEELARELGYVKPGETAVLPVPEAAAPPSSPSPLRRSALRRNSRSPRHC